MIYLILLLLSFALTYLIKEIAIRKSLVAIPNARSSHTVPIPHGGGIAVVLTWFIGLSYFFYTQAIDPKLFYALIVGGLISLVSFFDDLYDLDPKIRILVQFSATAAGLYLLGGLNVLDFGFFSITNPYITNGIAVVATLWFINLYNFLDGIDGYAGSEALFLSLAGFSLFSNNIFLLLAVAVSGFLFWNWHQAKIFMGDVGSTLLGYTVAIISIYYQNEGSSILVWVILFGLFWFDATLTLVRRFKNREKLSQAHKKHAYQRLVQSGWKHDKVVFYAMGVNLLLFLLAYGAKLFGSYLLVFFLISVLLLYGVMYFVDQRKGF